MNGKVHPYPKEYENDLCWINPWTDIAYAAKAILQGRLSLGAYLGSLMGGKKVSALFEKGDARPGIAYLLNMMSYLKKR
jgi:predicted ATP-grasp superfamily ATP-dependent carboligase